MDNEVETNGKNRLNVLVPPYPHLVLRKFLVAKDGEKWAQSLIVYIRFLQFIVNTDLYSQGFSVATQQSLYRFLKSYIHETFIEKEKAELKKQEDEISHLSALLRAYVFTIVKNYSFVKLTLTGASIWEFVCIYVDQNCTTVRELVDGTFKSKFAGWSGNVSSIKSLQKYLEKLITDRRFDVKEVNILSCLLGQHVSFAKVDNAQAEKVNIVGQKSMSFAESFVNVTWIETLESLYSSYSYDLVKDIMVISLISLSTAKVANLVTELGIVNIQSLKITPLLSSIIVSGQFRKLMPGLEEKLPFLRHLISSSTQDAIVDEGCLHSLLEMMPQLTLEQAISSLKMYDNDVEKVVEIALENPDMLAEAAENTDHTNNEQNLKKFSRKSVYDDDKISNLQYDEDSVIFSKKPKALDDVLPSESIKKKTLSAALKMVYDSDEDEPDDTYADTEKNAGEALEDANNGFSLSSDRKFAVPDDNDTNSRTSKEESLGTEKSSRASLIDEKEKFLFALYKSSPQIFDRASRKASSREKVKNETHWTDEQIEGWLKMLLKSPKRYKVLDEDYFYNGNSKMLLRKEKSEENGDRRSVTVNSKQLPKQSKDSLRKLQARKEKNKASKANHNRKAASNKKGAL